MAGEANLDQKLEDVTDGSASARKKLRDYRLAIEGLQAAVKGNPARTYGPITVIGSVNGVATTMTILGQIGGVV